MKPTPHSFKLLCYFLSTLGISLLCACANNGYVSQGNGQYDGGYNNSYQNTLNAMGFPQQNNGGQAYGMTPITPSTINGGQMGQIIGPNGSTTNVLIQDNRQPGMIGGGVFITPMRK